MSPCCQLVIREDCLQEVAFLWALKIRILKKT